MSIKCALYLEYKDNQEARMVYDATRIENEGFIAAQQKDNALIAEITSENLQSLNHTLEDFLACISVAENTIDTG